jgi:hypothetical protein
VENNMRVYLIFTTQYRVQQYFRMFPIEINGKEIVTPVACFSSRDSAERFMKISNMSRKRWQIIAADTVTGEIIQ